MAFHVGMRVECIDDDFVTGNVNALLPPNLPKLHGKYIIRAIDRKRGRDFVRLVELVNPLGKHSIKGQEPAFCIRRFRPLTDRKSEVSFTIGADPESEAWDNRRRVKVRS